MHVHAGLACVSVTPGARSAACLSTWHGMRHVPKNDPLLLKRTHGFEGADFVCGESGLGGLLRQGHIWY